MGWSDSESWGYSSFSGDAKIKSIDAGASTGGDGTAFGDTQAYRNLMETVNEILNNPNYTSNYLLFKNDGRRVTFWLLDFSTPRDDTKSFDEEGEAKNIQGIIGHTMSFQKYLQKYGAQISVSNYNFGDQKNTGYDYGYAGNVIGAGGTTFSSLENAVANKYWWMDAKGNYKLTKLLEKGVNGKYIRGVQGLRNGYSSALKVASVYKVAGNTLGGLGLGITYLQYRNGQISGTEATVDAAFGVIGFMGPIGAGVSATYFLGKLGYEYFSGNTVFEKPQ